MTNTSKIYSAPLQGFTDFVWRNAHAEVFGNVDIYYTPFMRMVKHSIPNRYIADVNPENNVARIRPQILGTNPADASFMVKQLRDMGYTEIDINLGCPHPPIAGKKKGSGMLAHPALCEQLFVALSKMEEVRYSIKMRLGYDSFHQWQDILPLMDISMLYEACHYPIIYNGDITTTSQIELLKHRYPQLSGVMVGRALLAKPYLFCNYVDSTDIERFHTLLYSQYRRSLTGGEHQILTKMKSLWEYFLPDADKKLRKAIKKCNSIPHYEQIVAQIFKYYTIM